MRACEAIIATVEQEHPPLRLPLGAFAYDAMGKELESVGKEFATVKNVALGADFPKGA